MGAAGDKVQGAAPLTAAPAPITFDRPGVSTTPARVQETPAPVTAQGGPSPAAAPESAVPAQPAASASALLAPPLAVLQVTSPFGLRSNPITRVGEMHTGTDFAGACGTPVIASAAGTVTEAGWSAYGGGNRIVIDHGAGIKTTYNHLANIGVSLGQQVSSGALISGVGTTGMSTGCHLHYEVMLNDATVDPALYV